MECQSYPKTALCWLIMVILPYAAVADVIAVTRNNVSYTFPSMPANFGDRLPMNGFQGKLVVAVPLNGCHSLQHPPHVNTSDMMSFNYFALIKRDDCNFDFKVWNAQRAGYAGAVVYNSGSDDGVLPMNGEGEYGPSVYIPSVFVGATSGKSLEKLNYTSGARVTLTRTLSFPVSYFLYPFVIVTSTCLFFFGIYMVAKFVRDRRQLKRSRLSRTNLKKIPVKKFVKGDDYDVCAICLDDYEEGDKLRILPCNHAFHCKCVDPWLTNNRRTCPVCKRKVVPSGEADSDESDSDDDSAASPTEHTPLLAGGSANRGERGQGNTTDTPATQVDGAWGGEERPGVTLVDASTAMTENDSDKDDHDDDDRDLLSRSPINDLPRGVGFVTPTLHAVPDNMQEASVNQGLVDDSVPVVVVINENMNPNQDSGNHNEI